VLTSSRLTQEGLHSDLSFIEQDHEKVQSRLRSISCSAMT
jgi:hypothetical protein